MSPPDPTLPTLGGRADNWVTDRDPDPAFTRYLDAGESLIDTIALGSTRLGVTTHRVIILDHDGDGATVQTVLRPNVTDVTMRTRGSPAHGHRAAHAAVSASVLLGAGWAIDLDGLNEPIAAPAGIGITEVIDLANTLFGLIALIDDAFLLAGLLALGPTVISASRYLSTRTHVLEITIAGDDPVRIPTRGDTAAATRLQTAVEKTSNGSGHNPA